METNMELSKTRDFGEIISDTFGFVRQNLKPLLSCFFTFCGFFLLVGTVTGILEQLRMANFVNTAFAAGVDSNYSPFGIFGVELVLLILSMIFTFTAMPVAILSFMALYKEKGNIAPTNEEVWGYFKYYFFKVMGSGFVNIVLLMVGFLFCFIPGIYLYAVLALVFPIMIMENTTYGYAFNQSFRIIKDNWWTVFGVLFIIGIIVTICSAAVTVPFTVINMGSLFIRPVKGVHLSFLSTVIATILKQLSYVLYILHTVAIAICYYSLTETKDATGLMSRINQLGNNDADTNLPAEEY